MKAKNILMICLFISGLFSLPSKAQQPGENVSSQTIRKLGEKHFFSISTIPDDIFRLMQGKTYKKNCTVARSELRYIRCLHVDKDGRNIVGEMVVNRAIATDVLDILKKLYEAAKQLQAPYELVKYVHENGKLPVVNFAAGGVATPADAALMMQLGAEGVFVGSGIFKSGNPAKRAQAIVKAVTNYNDPKMLAELSEDLGEAMVGINEQEIALLMAERGK